MSNTSISLVNLDFNAQKQQLKAFLKSQDVFKDYDFEGSNISVLLDLLSYNTYTNSFYLNMVASEMFLDSAQLKDSVVSHAKMLNYIPRSFKSARATVNITVVGDDNNISSIIAPKGTSFTARVGSNSFTFSLNKNLLLQGANGIFVAQDVDIYEGKYFSESFITDYSKDSQKFILNNQTIDTDSLVVSSLEDNGATTINYGFSTSLLGKNSNSAIFFLQGSQNDRYEIVFGDGVVGRRPKDGGVILCEYRVTNGELPNGAFKFVADGSISGYSNVFIETVTAAYGGAVSESIESIRLNAPRYFAAQERAITTEDYENLLKINYPEVLAVSAYGGEEISPPQYGRVFVAIDINQVDGLPDGKKREYYNFLKTRAPLSVEPVIVEPDILYLHVVTTVKYNINTTTLTSNDIEAFILSSISNYSTTYLNGFKKTFRYSQFVTSIDDANPNILSNETRIDLIKKLTPQLNTNLSFVVNFDAEIDSISSTAFIYQNKVSRLQDTGNGVISIVTDDTGDVITPIGSIDTKLGKLTFNNFNIQSFYGTTLKIYATPVRSDVTSLKRTILQIVSEDVEIAVEQVRV
jgi:hypothetical protein